MTSRETLECRIFIAEDAMYRRSEELNRHLHDLESGLKKLADGVHHELCEIGVAALEGKADRITRAIEAFEADADLDRIRAEADRVTSLRGLIELCERQLAGAAEQQQGGTPSDHTALEVLAAAG